MTALGREVPSELSGKYHNDSPYSFLRYAEGTTERIDATYNTELRLATLSDSETHQWNRFKNIFTDRYNSVVNPDSITSQFSETLNEFTQMDFLEELERLYDLSQID